MKSLCPINVIYKLDEISQNDTSKVILNKIKNYQNQYYCIVTINLDMALKI